MKRKNITLTEEQYEYLSNHDNASALIRRLLNAHIEGYDTEAVLIDYQIERLSGDIAQSKAQLNTMEERYEELISRKERMRRTGQNYVEQFVEETSDHIDTSPESPAIQNFARKANMNPAEFSRRVEEERHR